MNGRRRWRRWRRLWSAPLGIGAAITAGLAVALLAEGPAARAAVCGGLAAPILTASWFAFRR